MVFDDRFDDGRVNGLVLVDDDVTESHQPAQPVSKARIDDSSPFEQSKGICHRVRTAVAFRGHDVGCEVDGSLDGALEIQCRDVININGQEISAPFSMNLFDPGKTAIDGVELREHHVAINHR